MSALRWHQLVADVIGEYATDNMTIEHILDRLKSTGDYEVALAQFRVGASDRVIKNLLRLAIRNILGCD